MIAVNDNAPRLTPEQYLVWEETRPEKYEYIDGEVYAMSGGSVNHGRIAIRLTTLFDTHLEGSDCITGNSDIKVKIAEAQNYTYPDASVTCDARDRTTPQYITYPCLVVEVLSEGTEAYDRGGKFRLYRQNPVLQDYLLVSSTKIEMDLYHKTEADDWVIINYQPGDTIELQSIGLSFAIEHVYRGLILTPDSQPTM
ncbi:Uma2 family endonuclease [Nodosilinea sp. PGN35]|uniref:Uma2 family endonuclease n=1 Tax=Nodosilinea sp. PGN35 TaxID=3020489 RepID=UPI0023B323AB|nr:Uma2 family endonuclease [Nodosilinea sp. TSF1-S3]MDF0366316.1 Uma2 family endonuclease [Nodosilinea sp. TSF1-S3]